MGSCCGCLNRDSVPDNHPTKFKVPGPRVPQLLWGKLEDRPEHRMVAWAREARATATFYFSLAPKGNAAPRNTMVLLECSLLPAFCHSVYTSFLEKKNKNIYLSVPVHWVFSVVLGSVLSESCLCAWFALGSGGRACPVGGTTPLRWLC